MGCCASKLSSQEEFNEKDRRAQSFQTAEQVFQKSNPAFNDTVLLDRLRRTDYSVLDKEGHIYMDYTGAGLSAESQLRKHFELLHQNIFGNPHTLSPTSRAITELDEQARNLVLTYFRASPDEYTVIFTANASHAIKLVGEAYPFSPDGELMLLWDNHNSIHGMREFARTKGTNVTYVPVVSPEMRADEGLLRAALQKKSSKSNDNDGSAPRRLFSYPAQSNFTGVQHPLEWIETAQAQGWDVLLDAAAFIPTNHLDLSRWHPDFVPISFYKMFGYPSGVGCLLARKVALSRLTRPWFAGGTVWGTSVQADRHVLLGGNEAFEDGTINYLSLPAVYTGLNHLTGIGIEMIHKRVICLTNWLLEALLSLRHSNGKPLIVIYGPETCEKRGGTIAFNFTDLAGRIVDERIVEQRAISIRLSLRTGCFCNPGAGEAAFKLSKKVLVDAFNNEPEDDISQGQGRTLDSLLDDMGMPTGGAIRISLGIASNFADVYRFVQFAHTFLDSVPVSHNFIPRARC